MRNLSFSEFLHREIPRFARNDTRWDLFPQSSKAGRAALRFPEKCGRGPYLA
jgi:hypothetical protein